MEFTKRNVIVSVLLTLFANIASYLACRPEAAGGATDASMALYGAAIGFSIGIVGEFVNFITQNPKSSLWLAVLMAPLTCMLTPLLCN